MRGSQLAGKLWSLGGVMSGMKYLFMVILTAAVVVPLSPSLVAADGMHPAPEVPTAATTAPGYLGIQLDEVDEALTYHLGLTNDLGIVVAGVAVGGSGEAMGLKMYDVVVAANDAPIYTPRALGEIVKAKHAGEVLRLTVRRGATSVELSGKLAARPAEFPAADPRRMPRQFPSQLPGKSPILGANGQRRGTITQPDGSTMEWSIDESPEPPPAGAMLPLLPPKDAAHGAHKEAP